MKEGTPYNRGMGAKGTVLCIAVVGVLAVLIFVAVASTLASPQDVQMEARLDGVLAKYRFERSGPYGSSNFDPLEGNGMFISNPLSDEQIEELVSTLLDGCQGCTTNRSVGTPTYGTTHTIYMGEDFKDFNWIRVLQRSEIGHGISNPDFASYVLVNRDRGPSSLGRIRSWLGW